MFMDAIIASGTPDKLTTSGNSDISGRKYRDIVQDMWTATPTVNMTMGTIGALALRLEPGAGQLGLSVGSHRPDPGGTRVGLDRAEVGQTGKSDLAGLQPTLGRLVRL